MPASSPDFFETGLEGRILGVCRGAPAAAFEPRCMHAPLVLGEEIFTVEVVGLAGRRAGSARSRGRGRGEILVGRSGLTVDAAFAHIAAIEA